MKIRKQRLCIVEGEGWPIQPIGMSDVVMLMGSSADTVRSAMNKGKELYGYTIIDVGYTIFKEDRRCIRCGKEIGNTKSTVYCDECQVENKEIGKKRKAEREGSSYVTGSHGGIKHKVPYEKKSPLAKYAWDAAQAKMSYGQYETVRESQWHSPEKSMKRSKNGKR